MVNNVNPARGILDGEGLMLWQNRCDNAANLDRVSALCFFALQVVDFSDADQQWRPHHGGPYIFGLHRRRFHKPDFVAAWDEQYTCNSTTIGSIGATTKTHRARAAI